MVHICIIHILDAIIILQVLLNGQVIIQDVVLQTKTNILPNIICVVGEGFPQDLNCSAVGWKQPSEEIDSSWFSCSIMTQQTENFWLIEIEGEIVDDQKVFERFRNINDSGNGSCGPLNSLLIFGWTFVLRFSRVDKMLADSLWFLISSSQEE